jgi:hypothetical protein
MNLPPQHLDSRIALAATLRAGGAGGADVAAKVGRSESRAFADVRNRFSFLHPQCAPLPQPRPEVGDNALSAPPCATGFPLLLPQDWR